MPENWPDIGYFGWAKKVLLKGMERKKCRKLEGGKCTANLLLPPFIFPQFSSILQWNGMGGGLWGNGGNFAVGLVVAEIVKQYG
jgi:hypothetical protein